MENIDDFGRLITEQANPLTSNIDKLNTITMLRLINNEDKKVAYAVEEQLEVIAEAVDLIYEKLLDGGRLIYCGSGTSGRLGVLDAVECPPTYSVSSELVMGIIAGGSDSMFKAKEAAEDSEELCADDLKNIDFSEKDVLVAIAASGRTPYVLGGVKYARSLGAKTIFLTCNDKELVSGLADITISVVTGPEAVTGSTRMKAGTAQKLVLNMLSTGTMIKLGKVYGNLMVDVKPTNKKLVERSKRIVMASTRADLEQASLVLEETRYNVKLAILMLNAELDMEDASSLLDEYKGHISNALEHCFNQRRG